MYVHNEWHANIKCEYKFYLRRKQVWQSCAFKIKGNHSKTNYSWYKVALRYRENTSFLNFK